MRLLPYVERTALFDRYDPSVSWSKNTASSGFTIPNYVLASTRINSYECPSAPNPDTRFDYDPQSSSQPYAVPTTYAKATTNAAGTDFSNVSATPGFAAPSDYGATIYGDNALANTTSPLVPDDNKADKAAAAVPVADKGNTTPSSGDGLPAASQQQQPAGSSMQQREWMAHSFWQTAAAEAAAPAAQVPLALWAQRQPLEFDPEAVLSAAGLEAGGWLVAGCLRGVPAACACCSTCSLSAPVEKQANKLSAVAAAPCGQR